MLGLKNNWRRYTYRLVAEEISTLARYCDQVIHWQPLAHESGLLLEQIACREKLIVREDLPNLREQPDVVALILMNGNINYSLQVQALLAQVQAKINRASRLALVLYNPYLRPLYLIANWLGLRRGPLPSTFVTRTDLNHLAALAGFVVVRIRPVVFVPHFLLGIGPLLNFLLPAIPILSWLSFAHVAVLRSVRK
jgi:hypothetical protein